MNQQPMMTYPPNAETAVYFLLGAMWRHLPESFRVTFTKFEITADDAGARHGKYLDAMGRDSERDDLHIEFKLRSSGLFQDVKKYRGLELDWLICWEHDGGAAVERRVKTGIRGILALRRVYESLDPKKRQVLNLFGDSTQSYRSTPAVSSVDDVLEMGTEESRTLARRLTREFDAWPTGSEIGLINDAEEDPRLRLVGRITAYRGKGAPLSLYVRREADRTTLDRLVRDLGARENPGRNPTLTLPLTGRLVDEADELVNFLGTGRWSR